MNRIQCKEVAADLEIDLMAHNDQAIAVICQRRQVSFNAVTVVIPNEAGHTPLSQLWYSRKEASSMRRECMVLSKYYKRLTDQEEFNSDELLGLEDIMVSRQRVSERKIMLQNILLQQEMYQAFIVKDSSTKIATISVSFSSLACEEALGRAARLRIETNEEQSTIYSPLGAIEHSSAAKKSKLPMASHHQVRNAPPMISFAAAKAPVTVPNIVNFKEDPPTRIRSFERQQEQIDLLHREGASTGIHTENAIRT